MVLRSIFHHHMRAHGSCRRDAAPMNKWTRFALVFVLAVGAGHLFKQIEPKFFPVIKDFIITDVVDLGEDVYIYGTLDKVRACEFVDVVAYSGDRMVQVVFVNSGDSRVTRLARVQRYGPWLVIPRVPYLELYSRHSCWTGTVTTKLFDGALAL